MHDWSGRFALRVDGQPMLAGRFSFHDQWRIFSGGGAFLRFPLGGKQAQLLLKSAGMTWRADLHVDRDQVADRPSVLVPDVAVPFLPDIALTPWWGWVCFAVALGATLLAIYIGFTTPVRRMPVALLGFAGAALCLRFSARVDRPLWARVALTVVAALASAAIARLSLPL
jgi:hypothetical protein